MGEFDLIRQYFASGGLAGQGAATLARVVHGIGDDCAILAPDAGMQLAISTDMLVEGRHFLPGADPARLGHKALAVNLSDLAAAGATPLGFTLSLALPGVDEAWLRSFSQGMLALARQTHCPLVGGDTTKGPLTLNITVLGQMPAGQALLRSGARAGDDVYVSGAIGEARLGLAVALGEQHIEDAALRQRLLMRLERPQPRLALGQALRGLATSAMDLSDGLVGDLAHIARASNVGMEISMAAVRNTSPIWNDAQLRQWPFEQQCFWGLSGGDDYELAFTAAVHQREAIARAVQQTQTPVHRIGRVTARAGDTAQGSTSHHPIWLEDPQGRLAPAQLASFDHFK